MQQIADDVGEDDATRLFSDAFLLCGVNLSVEPGEAAGNELTVSSSWTPIITPVVRSLSGTEGLVMSGWLAVLSECVTPTASTIT